MHVVDRELDEVMLGLVRLLKEGAGCRRRVGI